MNDDDDTVIIREAEDNVAKREGESSQEKRREEAFHAGYSWRGQTINGLSSSRKMVCDALCYKAGLPPLNAGFNDLQWFAPMAQALVFVCSLHKDRLKKTWALGIDVVFSQFLEWVDDNVNASETEAIIDLGQRLLIDSRENQAEALPSGTPGK